MGFLDFRGFSVVLYEVRLKVEDSIREKYLVWLKSHIVQMLDLKCFISADIYQDAEFKNNFLVHYKLQSQEKMDFYLKKYAKEMRNQANLNFKGKFIATRAVYKDL